MTPPSNVGPHSLVQGDGALTRREKIHEQSISSFLSISSCYPSIHGTPDKPVWWERAESLASHDGYRLITLHELRALYDSAQSFSILDVRPDYEYKAGHLPDALQLEFDLGERSNLKPDKRHRFESILGPDKGREIVIYCRNYQ